MALTGNNSTIFEECPPVTGALYWALNCYAMTMGALISNLLTLALGVNIIFLNSIVVSAVWRKSEIEDVADILIVSLAMADAFTGLFLLYQTAYNMVNWQLLWECMLRLGFVCTCNLGSVFGLVVLSVDRYIKITQPYIHQRLFKKGRVVSLSVGLWVLALVLGALPVMGWDSPVATPPVDERTVCGFFLVLGPSYRLLLIILFWIPLLNNCIMYGHIFQIAHRHARLISVQQKSSSRSSENGIRVPSKRTWKFTKTIALVMGFYFMSWCPTGIFLVIELFGQVDYMSLEERGLMVMYLSSLAYINSLVNPIIYSVKIPYIRKRFQQMFGSLPCCPCFKPPTANLNSTPRDTASHCSTVPEQSITQITT